MRRLLLTIRNGCSTAAAPAAGTGNNADLIHSPHPHLFVTQPNHRPNKNNRSKNNRLQDFEISTTQLIADNNARVQTCLIIILIISIIITIPV